MELVIQIVTSPISHIVLSAALVVCTLMQSSDNGLEGAFGGAGITGDSVAVTRRGPEAFFFKASIFCSIVLAGLLIATAVINS